MKHQSQILFGSPLHTFQAIADRNRLAAHCLDYVGAIVFLIMLALGEMDAFVLIAGSFCTFTDVMSTLRWAFH